MIWLILHIIEILLWLLLAASGAYILFFALVSMLWKKPVSPLSASSSPSSVIRQRLPQLSQ